MDKDVESLLRSGWLPKSQRKNDWESHAAMAASAYKFRKATQKGKRSLWYCFLWSLPNSLRAAIQSELSRRERKKISKNLESINWEIMVSLEKSLKNIQ